MRWANKGERKLPFIEVSQMRYSTIGLVLLLSSSLSAEEGYRVGVAAVDITPSHAIRLNGFGNRRTESDGVYQRVWAKALAIEDDTKEPVLLITLDVLGIPDDLRREIGQRLAKKAGLKPERLSITATHTHTGPMLKGANVTIFGVPIPKEHLANIDRYTAEFLDKLERVGLEALKNRTPAKLSYGIGQVGFATNRRTRGGPVDHDLPVLFVHDLQGKVRAIYTNYATHCVTLSLNKLGGDWAGYAQEALQDAFPGAVALVSIGCGADSNPNSGVTGDKLDVASLQGRAIAQEVKRLTNNFLAPVTGRIVVQTTTIELPLGPLPTKEQWEEKAKRTDAIGHHARVQLEKLARKEALPTKVLYPIHTWSFGSSLGMVFLPGEVVVDYALRLKRELDGQRLWVNAYANDAPCYIPSERVLKEGGYEGGGAMIYYDQPVPFKEGLETPIIKTVHDHLAATFPPKYDGTRTAGSRALSPQQSLATLKTKPGLTVELAVAEPFIVDPVAIDFGPDGQIWVAEMVDYPQGKAGRFEPGGRVRLVQMNDAGRCTSATVFLDNIPFPTGVTVWRKGVLICAAPDILYAEDTNGDGVADVVKKLFSGFGTENYQARVNSLQYGLDGWVYGSCGLFGGKIKSFNGKEYTLGDRDFRIKPDTGELEPVTGRTQQGRVRNDAGAWFGCDNSTLLRHYATTDHYLKRNPHVPTPDGSVFVPQEPNPNRLYPAKGDQQRFKLSGPPNMTTAACGLGLYRDVALGDAYQGNTFTCEPVNLLVHRQILTAKRTTYEGKRAADEQDSEFLTGTDNWFRPVQAITGPDGALWVVDMYRFIIEHPRWIPPDEAKQYDLRAGQGMGRLYRVTKENQRLSWPRLGKLSAAQLVAALDHPNGWQRDLVTQMLLWRGDKDSVPALRELVAKSSNAVARLHALVVLEGLNALQSAEVLRALDDPAPMVRGQALRLAEVHVHDPAIAKRMLAAARDAEARVRLQAAYSLGAFNKAEAAAALATMAVQDADDPFISAAVLSSLHRANVAPTLDAVLQRSPTGPPAKFVQLTLQMAVALKIDGVQNTLLKAATTPRDGRYEAWQFSTVAGFLPNQDIPAELAEPLKKLMQSAYFTVSQGKYAIGLRSAALPLLGRAAMLTKQEVDLFEELLAPTTPPELRSATIAHLGRVPDERARQLFFDTWKSQGPAARTQMLDVLLSRPAGAKQLLGAVQQKTLLPAEIDAARRQRLLTHPEESVRTLAAKAFEGAINPDRAKIIKVYAMLPAGDVTRGKAVFAKLCAACHKLDGVGTNVGPDLAALAQRTPAYLLQEILDPNRNVDSRYLEYRATTAGGRTVTGLLAAETATTIILRGQQGKDETLLRSTIEEFRSSGKSLMPEGLEKDLPAQSMADLFAYLAGQRPPRREFPNNVPTLVKVQQDRLTLKAIHAELYGTSIELEQEFKNLGMWHGLHDRAEWRVQLDQARTFDVYLDFACAAGSDGNPIVFEAGDQAVRTKVPSTGTWSQYRTQKIGTLRVAAGDSRLVLRADGMLRNALIDLRTIFLVPEGTPITVPPRDVLTEEELLAKMILDEALPRERREKLVQSQTVPASVLLRALTKDINDAKEEYRRIPWIWRVAIAAGKRNDAQELRAILNASLPQEKQPLRDWQAVVIGGGLINGISQVGAWPEVRFAEIIGKDAALAKRWQTALAAAYAMADAATVPAGTRYDALRMIPLDTAVKAEPALAKYLPKGTNAELQMGAVSGLNDVVSPRVASLLLKHLADMPNGNRTLALDALLRTPERTAELLTALEKKTCSPEWFNAMQRTKLTQHPQEALRQRALQVFGSK